MSNVGVVKIPGFELSCVLTERKNPAQFKQKRWPHTRGFLVPCPHRNKIENPMLCFLLGVTVYREGYFPLLV
jgi:hypothetical protein